MARKTTSAERTPSATVAGRAPVSAATSPSVSGPRELAIATSCPAPAVRRAMPPPILPAPITAICMRVSSARMLYRLRYVSGQARNDEGRHAAPLCPLPLCDYGGRLLDPPRHQHLAGDHEPLDLRRAL